MYKEFAVNLAKGAPVKASSYRGNAKQYSPANITDGHKNTYWATDDAVTTANFAIDLGKVSTIKYVLLQEYIRLGQRIKAFTLEAWKDNKWQKIGEGTTIGYKRIVKVDAIRTNKIKVIIEASKSCPVISNVEVF